ncbi:hypothetical protein KR026_002416 [Drosophila bipectinata]|nr:hypothetical protein KR026_002416 [Drosophila bipectinata]
MITFYFWVAAGILLWIHFLWSRRRFYKLMFEIPGPKGIPFLGTIPEYVINKRELYYITVNSFLIKSSKYTVRIIQRTKHMDKYGSTILIWMGIQPVLLTRDPKIAEDILISSQCLNRTSLITKAISDTFAGRGLLTMKEPEWQQHRKNLNSSFKRNVLLSFLPIFNSEATILVNIMERFVGQKGTDVLPHLLRWSFRTSHRNSLNLGNRKLITGKIFGKSNILFLIFRLLMVTMLNIALPFCRHTILSTILGFKRRKVGHLDRINAFMNDIIDLRLHSESESSKDLSPNIAINRVMELYRNGEITLDEVKGESCNMVLAAFETTALTLNHLLIVLAMFPQYQELLFEELKEIFPAGGDFEVEYEDVQKLVYLDRVLNETLRLFPPIPISIRDAKEDLRLSNGVLVPKGVIMCIDIFNIHRNRDHWGHDADTFDPDRFLPDNIRQRHPYAFIPYSKGKRNCIGWRYAQISLKIALAKIVRNYSFNTSFRYEDLAFIDNIVVKMDKAPLLRFNRRPT